MSCHKNPGETIGKIIRRLFSKYCVSEQYFGASNEYTFDFSFPYLDESNSDWVSGKPDTSSTAISGITNN